MPAASALDIAHRSDSRRAGRTLAEGWRRIGGTGARTGQRRTDLRNQAITGRRGPWCREAGKASECWAFGRQANRTLHKTQEGDVAMVPACGTGGRRMVCNVGDGMAPV